MIRRWAKSRAKTSQSEFRFRGVDNTRIEALSDGVFAIATALLIISSSIPETYDELLSFLEDIVPFAICMTLLMLIWEQHYLFFLRYGFKDAKIVAINTLFLFLVLFYIYPLKFLFTLLNDMFVGIFTGNQAELDRIFTEVIHIDKTPDLMTMYGLGVMGIFVTLGWMYRIAHQRREQLKLTALEIHDTKTSMQANFLMSLVPLLSILLAQILSNNPALAFLVSGWSYGMYPAFLVPFWKRKNRQRLKLIG